MTKSNTFKEIIQPFIVLVGICLLVGVLLGALNSVTAPVIAENQRIEQEKTRAQVLPTATGFAEVECDTEVLGVNSVYADVGGTGYVIEATRKGYGGDVRVTVGIDADGKIVGITADTTSETTGIGSKAGDRTHLDLYMGLSGSAEDIDTISGATYSSKAVKEAVTAILGAYNTVKEAA